MARPVGDIVDQLKRAREARQRARNCLKAMQAAGYEAIKQQERFDSTDQKVRVIIESAEYKQHLAIITKARKDRKNERDRGYKAQESEEQRAKRLEKARAIAAKRQADGLIAQWREKPEVRTRIVKLKAKYRREAGAKERVPKRHDAHVTAYGNHQAKEAIRKARERLHSSHVECMKSLSEADEYRWRYRTDPEFNIRERLRNQLKKFKQKYPKLGDLMRCSLKNNGTSKAVSSILGYSIADLRHHLEKQFTKGMTWDRFGSGEIHIDHIVPKSTFDLEDEEDIRKCWCMSNLRPLWAKANLEKRAKREFLL